MEDYQDAAKRHCEDAKILHIQDNARLANASHLYGFAAECVIKSMMAGSNRRGRVSHCHLPDIMVEFRNHSSIRGNAALLRSVNTCFAGLSEWKVSERYLHQNAATFTVERVQSEADSVKKLLGLLSHWTKGVI